MKLQVKTKKRIFQGLLAFTALLLFGLGLSVLSEEKLIQQAASLEQLHQTEAIFPLGYFANKNGVSTLFKMRLDLAAELWGISQKPIWLLGAKVYGDSFSNAHYGKLYLMQKGVDPKAIVVYDNLDIAINTVDTFTETEAAILLAQKKNVDHLAVISDPLQLIQVQRIFSRSQLKIMYFPTRSSAAVLPLSKTLVYQLIRRGVYLLSWIDPHGKTLFWLRFYRTSIKKTHNLL